MAFGPVAVPAGLIRNCAFISNTCNGDPGGKSDGGGIDLVTCSYRIENCTLYDNFTGRRGGGIKLYGGTAENYVIKNCILWNNRTSTSDPDPLTSNGGWELAVQQDSESVPLYLVMSYTDWTPVGKDKVYYYYRDNVRKEVLIDVMEADPSFADASAFDFHEKSWAGRWENGVWAYDETNSPCIDAGDPASAFAVEQPNNGGRINMGAYGNTEEASRSGPPRPLGTTITLY